VCVVLAASNAKLSNEFAAVAVGVAVVAGRKLLHLAVQICPALISPKHMALVAPLLSLPHLFSSFLYLYLFQFIFYFFYQWT